jgi:hypothetical protein
MLALYFILGFAVFPGLAQSASTGQLRGTVRDPQGAVVAGATVTLTEQATGSKREVTTSSNGDYMFTPASARKVPAGSPLGRFQDERDGKHHGQHYRP